jgi:hypothetical protein
MATKIKLMRLLQEVRGHAQIMNRRPSPRQPTLYLMHLREHSAEVHSPKRRLAVTADSNENANVPLPIKIHHIKGDAFALPMIVG